MTRKQFEVVPYRENWHTEIICDWLVILPSRKMHDSGYRCMNYVAIKDGKALCRLSSCSDVMHIDGIGGYGRGGIRVYEEVGVDRKEWSVDCLQKSGLLRMWCDDCDLICGPSLSSFEVWAVKREKKE